MVKLTVSEDILAQVQQAADAHQPELNVRATKDIIILDGLFVVSASQGPFDSYQVRVEVPAGFPWEEPRVFEIGDRIPKIADRHIIPHPGNCCLCIWEEWLLTVSDPRFESFLTGVMHDYFVSQSYFESRGEWPFGQRSHGEAGILESFAEILDVDTDARIIVEYLRLLSMNDIKGHHLCPCGSDRRLRQCHRNKVDKLKKRIPTVMARRMLARVAPKKHRDAA